VLSAVNPAGEHQWPGIILIEETFDSPPFFALAAVIAATSSNGQRNGDKQPPSFFRWHPEAEGENGSGWGSRDIDEEPKGKAERTGQ